MSYNLTIEPGGESIAVEEGQSILDAALRAGLWLPYACNHGLCGTCKVQLLDGEIDHGAASPFALMDIERDEGKCLACVATLKSDTTIEADIEEEPDALHLPVRDHTGIVAALDDLTPTIKGVQIELEGEGIAFQAGQYVNLRIPGEETPRAFSIASPPSSPTRIELNVRLVPGGKATTYIHRTLKPGDKLAFAGPLGRFFVRKSLPEPIIFLAGGSGLSSPKSMILDLFERSEARPIVLIYGARNRAELYADDVFRNLAAKHPNFKYIPALSEPPPDDAWDGERGFVHDVANRVFAGRFEGHKAYLCGPPVMIDACVTALMRGRLFEKNIFTESFFTAADGTEQGRRSPLFQKF